MSQHRGEIKSCAGKMLRMNIKMALHPAPRRNYTKYFMLIDNIEESTP